MLDKNIVLTILRAKDYGGIISLLNPENVNLYISVATEAELKSIAMQHNWGAKKTRGLDDFLDELVIVEIYQSNVSSYVEIDAYSQRKTLHLKIIHL